MGGAVAAALHQAGHRVLWASAERSEQTRQRASAAELEDVGSLAELAERSEILLAICPPHASLELAVALSGFSGFSGIYIDANATSPATAEQIAMAVGAHGATYVDGSIIGPPPLNAGSTRLYLSGAEAGSVAAELSTPLLEAIALPGEATSASAIKMAHAGWTKGSAALLLTVRAAARALGVDDALAAEWERSQPGLVESSNRAAQSTAAKAWRWSGEMDEIAATLAAAGLPDGFHRASSEVFDRIGNELDPDDLELLVHLLETLAHVESLPPSEQRSSR
jgi:3-hydroxyisobutyrate dehydrogenase-like beta-hydroxyacid dehydrogenase